VQSGAGTTEVDGAIHATDTEAEASTVLALPLLVRGEVYGGFIVAFPIGHQISKEESQLVATLAERAGLAIETARLRTEVRRAAVAAERSRLARDLHDSVTQGLYSMMLYADATGMALSAGKQDVAADNLQQLRGIAREAMLDMRILIFELHPPVLEEQGLVGAIQARLATVEARAGIHTDVTVEGERRLPPHIEEELFWIVREALNNAVKHARATRVAVALHFGQDFVRLSIEDDGRGFDPTDPDHRSGIGLRGVEERAQRINGHLEIVAVPTVGTTLTVTAPL
jgi:signal transduction histidine kinase